MRIAIVAIAALVLLGAKTPEKKINWITIEEAQELVKKEPKKILIDVYID